MQQVFAPPPAEGRCEAQPAGQQCPRFGASTTTTSGLTQALCPLGLPGRNLMISVVVMFDLVLKSRQNGHPHFGDCYSANETVPITANDACMYLADKRSAGPACRSRANHDRTHTSLCGSAVETCCAPRRQIGQVLRNRRDASTQIPTPIR
jgi:hypothetical protein